MTLKMMDVDEKKWNLFKLWCNHHGVKMKAEMDKILSKYAKEAQRWLQ